MSFDAFLEDGGATWSTITFSYGTINDFHFINDSIGFAVTGSDAIYKTTDEGITWFLDYDDYYSDYGYENIFFLNEDTGYVYGRYGADPLYLIIEKTINGGDSWSLQHEEDMGWVNSPRIMDIIFRNNDEGFAMFDIDQPKYLISSGCPHHKTRTGSRSGIGCIRYGSIRSAKDVDVILLTRKGDYIIK